MTLSSSLSGLSIRSTGTSPRRSRCIASGEVNE
jgi:hypothetical protein